jgi:hypothetical protein
MKVTTVRFGEDLWALLEGEAERLDMSVSQYIREAALARAAFAAGSRAEASAELLARWAGGMFSGSHEPAHRTDTARLVAALSVSIAEEERRDAEAVRAHHEQAMLQAERIVGSKRRGSS